MTINGHIFLNIDAAPLGRILPSIPHCMGSGWEELFDCFIWILNWINDNYSHNKYVDINTHS